MHPVETLETVLLLLGAAVALYLLAAKMRLPPSAAVLIGGGALAFVPGLPAIALNPGAVPAAAVL
jgi:CPA1 family monovalent cation:H+ antiporter